MHWLCATPLGRIPVDRPERESQVVTIISLFLTPFLFLGRPGLTYWGACCGLERAGAGNDLRAKTWQGPVSQGGVTLGLVLLIEESFLSVGSGVVALVISVIVGNIIRGPILLERTITDPARQPEDLPESPVTVGTSY